MPAPTPRIAVMRVLLTNDDGITAPGLQAARRALREIDGVEVDMIAPDSNRSATARSITTRSPLSVEEVEFGDGDTGFATDGTPVDCVRFAELGLVGDRPDLIVSGINHGANLGDDITYSGTVAAAFEGIVLGIPAVAVSQQSSGGGMGYVSGRFDFGVAAALHAPSWCARLMTEPMPEATLINVNCPAGEPKRDRGDQARQAHLQRRAEAGRRERTGGAHYEIYGWQPGYEEIEGTDLNAVAERTDLGHADPLRPHRPRRAGAAARLGLRGDAGGERPYVGVSAADRRSSEPPSCGASWSTTTAATTSSTTRDRR